MREGPRHEFEYQYGIDEAPSEAMLARYEIDLERVCKNHDEIRKEITRDLIKKHNIKILCIQMIKKGFPFELGDLHPDRAGYLQQVQHPGRKLTRDHSDSFRNHLGFEAEEENFDVWNVSRGENFPHYKNEAYHAVIATGSEAMMTDTEEEDVEWINSVIEFMREWKKTGKPALLVCFGQQLYSQLQGGRVGWMHNKRGKVRELGPSILQLNPQAKNDSLLAGFDGDSLSVVASHMQEVSHKPPKAKVIAWNAVGKYQLLRHICKIKEKETNRSKLNTAIVSIQNHPEHTNIALSLAILKRLETLRSVGYNDEALELLLKRVIEQDTNSAREVLFPNWMREVASSIQRKVISPTPSVGLE